MSDRSLLLVHAHPDDETIGTGAIMARYAAEGARVTLVTCTLGEEGEIVVDDLAELAAGKQDRLGEHRITELAAACAELGVSDHRFLGGAGRFRDSGMMGTPTNDNPACFWQADVEAAAGDLVAVIREVRPDVVVTYDDNGGYGHPDHIQAHRVTIAAYDAAATADRYPEAGAPWTPRKLYYTALPMSELRRGFDHMKAAGGSAFEGVESADGLPFGTPDELVTTRIDGQAYVDRKMAAMRAHRSQIAEDGLFFSLPQEMQSEWWGVEHFTLARGELGADRDDNGRERDLFA